jgi:hypothetical protein
LESWRSRRLCGLAYSLMDVAKRVFIKVVFPSPDSPTRRLERVRERIVGPYIVRLAPLRETILWRWFGKLLIPVLRCVIILEISVWIFANSKSSQIESLSVTPLFLVTP